MDSENQNKIVNYCRILQLLRRGEGFLHKIFRERWDHYSKLNNKIIKWNDDEASGNEVTLICTSAAPKMKDLLLTGNVDFWDITLTNLAIQAVSKDIRKFGGQTDKNEDKSINALREVRNEIAHGKSELSDEDFIKYWDHLEDILMNFGDNNAEINKLKETFNLQGQKTVIEANPKSKFAELKEEANKLFKAEKYIDAIKIYDKILHLPGLLPENQALIFSNRSIAYLKLKDEQYLKMSKRDAEWAIQLWPCWWRGYFRLGQAEAKLRELPKAMESLEKALALNPKSKEVFDELSAVRHEHGIISRSDNLNPRYQPSLSDQIKEACQRQGISENEFLMGLKLVENTPMGDIVKGHEYRDGVGVSQDYIKAAAYYAKAAQKGFPEGMYNLSVLYKNGQGVKRDFDESHRWLLKAANFEPAFLCGVAEAQHSLGLKYSNGVGVEQSFKQAVKWYEKAIKNGFASSANNLGILYQNGQGVERSLKKAFQYFKISAQGGDTAAMQNLAHCYFAGEGTNSLMPTKDDIAEGTKWLRIAAEKGDLLAAKKLEKREMLTDDQLLEQSLMHFFTSDGSGPKSNPLDEKQFGKEIEQAAKNGSIIAKRQLEIWKNLHIAMEAFKRNNHDELISSLSKAIRLDFQIVEIPDIMHSVINKRIETHPTDIDAITCLIQIKIKQSRVHSRVPNYVFKYMEMYPSDEYFIEMYIAIFIGSNNYDAAIEASTLALKKFPNSLRFIYVHAIVLCMHSLNDKRLEFLDKFIALAPKDHDKVPACHYRKASYFWCTKQLKQFVTSFKAGLAAEKEQLPCFLPYQFPTKDSLMRNYTHLEFTNDKNNEKNEAKNAYLKTILPITSEDLKNDPQRNLMITNNRELIIKNSYETTEHQIHSTIPKPPNAPKPPKLTSLKPITLREIDPTKEEVYDGFVLEAKIIDWSAIIVGILTVIEDENGDIQRLAVYNWCPNANRQKYISKALKDFRPNVNISIINPYMRMAKDNKSIIRVESPIYIRIDDTTADQKCTFCGKETKVLPCSGCLVAFYCSKECQKFDWCDFNHKGICKHLK